MGIQLCEDGAGEHGEDGPAEKQKTTMERGHIYMPDDLKFLLTTGHLSICLA